MALPELPKWSLKIAAIEHGAIVPVEAYASIPVSAEWLAKYNPKPGGYFLVYADGCTSYAPTNPFAPVSTRGENLVMDTVHDGIEFAMAACHEAAEQWWVDHKGRDIRENPLTFSNKLMLIVSEVAEAMEGDRKDLMDDHLPHRKMREVELADALIRILDLAGGYNMDLAGAVVEKLAYNAKRADHKLEYRRAEGGKTY